MTHVSFSIRQYQLMNQHYELEVFYDNDCPLCKREVQLIRYLDRMNQILFTNIADPEFDAQKYGKTIDQFMDEIQARLPDYRWVKGVEVFRRIYSIVGFGWVVVMTRLPGLSHLLELFYRIFARNRLRLTGRCNHKNSTCDLNQRTGEIQL